MNRVSRRTVKGEKQTQTVKEPTKEDDNKRKLRSKDDNQKVSNGTLFNFDNVNSLLYRGKTIQVSKASSFKDAYRYNGDVQLAPMATSSVSNQVQISTDLLPRKSKQVDPLHDNLYEIFHKKMKREEKIMANEDRIRILSEVDNLQSQLQLLNQYDWLRYLPGICYINNPHDYDELAEKLELTITEITKLIRKHENWRRRNEILSQEIKQYDVVGGRVYEEDDEYATDVDTLRERRRRERRKSLPPSIKLKLHNGFTLVIDPINPPLIVSTADLEVQSKPKSIPSKKPSIRKNGNKVKKIVKPDPVKEEVINHPRQILKLSDVTDKDPIYLPVNYEKEIAFGDFIRISQAGKEGFQLPRNLKRLAEKSHNGRQMQPLQSHSDDDPSHITKAKESSTTSTSA